MVHALTPRRTEAPSGLPLTLASVKQHLRVDFSDDDEFITTCIENAVAHLDGYAGTLGRCILAQTWVREQCSFPASEIIRLPFPGVSAVVVDYLDTAGSSQVFAASNYLLLDDRKGSFIWLKPAASWPSTADQPNAVSVTMTAGYGAADDVPGGLKSALLLMIADMYAKRSPDLILLSSAVRQLLAPHRRTRIAAV